MWSFIFFLKASLLKTIDFHLIVGITTESILILYIKYLMLSPSKGLKNFWIALLSIL